MNLALAHILRYKVPAAGGLDAATAAWIAAVQADGGAVSGTQQTRVNTLVVALKAASLFTGHLWLYGGESDVSQAEIDIIGLTHHTIGGGMTLSAGGYTGNGTTGFLDSGIAPNAFGQDDISVGGYNNVAGANGNATLMAITNAVTLVPGFAGAFAITDLNDNAFGTVAGGAARLGRWNMSRTASNLITLYKEGGSVGTVASASASPSASNLFFFAENNGATGADFSDDRMAATWIRESVDATEAANFDAAVATYMTAWGI